MKTRDHVTHTIEWHDSGREPQCEPNPAYPDGIDVPSPRPAAKRSGVWHQLLVKCQTASAQAFAVRSSINPSCMQLSHRP